VNSDLTAGNDLFRKSYWPLVASIATILLFPWVGKSYFVLRIGIIALIYAINTVGMTLLVRYAGLISLGHSAFFAFGAYTSAILTSRSGLNPWLAMAVALLTSAGLAYLFSIPFLKLRKVYLAMATLGLGEVVYLLTKELSSLTGGVNGIAGIPYLQVGPLELRDDWQIFYLIGFFALLAVSFSRSISNSAFGRALHAIRTNEMAAEAMGIDAKRHLCVVFCFSAGLSALSGSLLAHFLTFISPDSFTINFSVSLLIFVVIGGANIWAGVITAVLLVAFSEVCRGFQDFSLGPYGLILMVALFVFPEGLAGIFRHHSEKTDTRSQSTTGHAEEMPGPVETVTKASASSNSCKETILELEDVSKAFGGNEALSEVCLSVPRDSILGVIGPNGAGKTTLLNVIDGFFPTSRGHIKFLNTDVTGSSPHRMASLGVGRTFQINNLFQGMTVIENVMVGAHLAGNCGMFSRGIGTKQAKSEERAIFRRAMESLDFLGLSHRAHNVVDELSFGDQRLVELSRALAMEPKLLLLDEIAAGLTGQEVKRLPRLLRMVRGRGITIILVEHNMPLVMSVSDSVMVLHFGQQLAFGTPSEISKNEEVIRAYLGESTRDA
jgi:branched-chain amino acid transport system permease protein